MRSRRRRLPKRTTLPFGVPNVAHDPFICSDALTVHPSQVAEANEVAQRMGCGVPFQTDGIYKDRRTNTKRYVEEINCRRGEGEARLVNFDGGYGDPI